MSIRTPRRRISPRARRRYRAIRNFFKRTINSLTSLSGNKINSSTIDNVTNMNRSHMMGHQLHAAPQNYRGLSSVGNIYRCHTEDLTPREENDPNSPMQRRRQLSAQEFVPNVAETKILYKTPDNLRTNSHECGLRIYDGHSDEEPHLSDRIIYAHCSSNRDVPNQKSRKNKQNRYDNFNRRGSQSRKCGGPKIIENSASGFDSYDCDSLTTPIQTNPGHSYRRSVPQQSAYYSRHQEHSRAARPDAVKIKRHREKLKRYKSKSPHASTERKKKRKNEPPANEEQQFIADIINRQYKPVCFFGRRASNISQISTPVCRDQRYSAREMVIPDSEISSFSRGPATPEWRHPCAAQVRDMRSLCDTRLYSAPWPARQRRRRADNYNDSNFYDVVPVKEKTSPKSRRKFIEDNLVMNEVPPSPRTHRPRLNLETQNYCDFDEYEQHENQTQRRSPNRRPECEYIQTFRQSVSTEESPRNTNEMSPKFVMRPNNTTRLHDETGTTMSSQHYLTSHDNTANNTLNNSKTQGRDVSVDIDKTDKALCEIKNILQNFLQELKKDSSTSQCDRVSGSDKNNGKQLEGALRGSDNDTSNAMKNSAGSFFNSSHGQGCPQYPPAMPPPFMPGFANPCCYPQVIPVYGAHGVPYLMASPSCVCASVACGHNQPRPQTTETREQCRTCSKVNCTEAETTKSNCETDVLIREIYNYVARNPNLCKKESRSSQDQADQNPRRKPSVGKSMHTLHQDANVGTAPLRCYSKSCEAIVSKQLFDTYYATYPSYSDSLIGEKSSREAITDYQMPRETNEYRFKEKRVPNNFPKQQSQDSKFTSALRLLRKKSKKENIHEVCHSEQSIEVDVIPKRHNFKQEFATYTMHGQEFLQPPPLRHDPRFPPTYDYDYAPHESPMIDYSNPRPVSDRYQHYDMPPEGPAFDNPYGQCRHGMEPRVPLCFKEVEVRSIGIQSEKKTSFRMFSQKKEKEALGSQRQPLVSILREDRKTDDKQIKETKPEKPRKLFKMKTQATASKSEPMASLTDRIQKDLTKNDKTVANAMMKKLFYKRNPFSPQNRFVRTIMEKDTPVYKWRPRMFL